MFPPVFPMETEVDLAVEAILEHSSDDHSSTASPPLAQTPPERSASAVGLLPSKRPPGAGRHPLDFALLDPISTAAVPVELISDEKSEDLLIQAAFPDFAAHEPWVESEKMQVEEMQPQRPLPRNARKLEESVAETLLKESIISVAFEVHQMSKLGLSFLFSADGDSPASSDNRSANDASSRLRSPPKIKRKQAQMIGTRPVVEPVKIHTSPSTDIFGQQLVNSAKVVRQHECVCPECGRSLAAARFAPHLEKCMGMGRNSSRLANRRIMQANAAERERPSSRNGRRPTSGRATAGGYGGTGSRPDSSSDSDESDAEEDEYEFDERGVLEDDDWFTSSKRPRGGGRKKTTAAATTKKVEKSSRQKYRNPLWGEPQEDNGFFHLGDLLDAPPISRRSEGGGGLFTNSGSHFSCLINSETPSPAGSETIVLRNRKVKKAKAETSLAIMEENSNSSFADLEMERRMGSEDNVQEVICLDDDDDDVDLV